VRENFSPADMSDQEALTIGQGTCNSLQSGATPSMVKSVTKLSVKDPARQVLYAHLDDAAVKYLCPSFEAAWVMASPL
jgi:hypothetical protein